MTREALEAARRLARRGPHDPLEANLLDELRRGHSPEDIHRRLRVPLPVIQGVRSFYTLLDVPMDGTVACEGTACRFARGGDAGRSTGDERAVRCVGRCYEAPATLAAGSHPVPWRTLLPEAAVLRHLARPGAPLAERYACPDAETILARVEASGLRGRGGAAFPTGAKWRAAARSPGPNKLVVANGDEGDPGSFVDRLLLEQDPHAVIAGLHACAKAVGATHALVYVRAEYPYAAERVRLAIGEAVAGGLIEPGLRVGVHVGAGSYVCGEETALIAAIEGLRAEPRPKPPYPTERGAFGWPTVVQNVETLAHVPELLRTGRRPESKLFSVSGAVAEPGAVEAPLGITLRRLLDEGAGGMAAGRRFRMASVGGPMGSVLSDAELDRPLHYDTVPGLGHGGVVVLDDTVSPRALAEHLYAFAAAESCGSCTPCRVGTSRLADCRDGASLERLLETLEMGSACGFGQGVPRPIRDLLQRFGDALFEADEVPR